MIYSVIYRPAIYSVIYIVLYIDQLSSDNVISTATGSFEADRALRRLEGIKLGVPRVNELTAGKKVTRAGRALI